ncbi:FAD-binding oxidoreductase [Marivita sp.]|uniref:FAD-binding oxidoreductase n=1 Tax=Marivita sp. TaxID=2003365 RepID=UPI0025BA1BE8|nr:FAD-binding oxidoreductase [Marivita sp.]
MRRQARVLSGLRHAKVETGLPSFSDEAKAKLSARFAGSVTYADMPGYNDARMGFMHTYQSFPQIIGYCVCESDVVAMLAFARDCGLKVVARAGGHSTAGFSVNDQVVVDTSGLSHVLIDKNARRARVGAGANFRKLNLMLDGTGLHVPGGGCETVCVAGYMQGGGYGFTSRLFGMNCDLVEAVTMVLADGKVVRASEDEHTDLFWAVRGGTGNQFGILTEIEYRLVELDRLFAFGLRFPLTSRAGIDTACRVLQDLQTGYTDGGAPGVGLQALLMNLPTKDKPEAQEPGLMIRGVFDGTEEQARAAIQPLLAHVTDEATQIEIWQTGRYLHLNEILLQTAHPPGIDMPAVSMNTKPLVDSRILPVHHDSDRWREIVTLFLAAPDKTSFIAMECYGGAINDIPPDKTAFVHRTDSLDMFAWSFWTFDATRDSAIGWLDDFGRIAGSMAVDSTGLQRRYQNYPRRGTQDFGDAYFGTNLDRLLRHKQTYDPTGLFDFEQGLMRCEGS